MATERSAVVHFVDNQLKITLSEREGEDVVQAMQAGNKTVTVRTDEGDEHVINVAAIASLQRLPTPPRAFSADFNDSFR